MDGFGINLRGFPTISGYSTIDNQSERMKTIGSVFASLIIALVTTALVYYNFYQMSEVEFKAFRVNPIVGEVGNPRFFETTAKDDFLEHGSSRIRTDVFSKKFPPVRIVECEIVGKA